MDGQQMIVTSDSYVELNDLFDSNKAKKILLVCGNSIKKLQIGKYFDKLEEQKGVKIIRFSDFQPNPSYESVVKGVRIFKEQDCNMVVAVGGGSAIDVAKCIKLYANMDDDLEYFSQEIIPNDIKLIAVPTTAGSGSEATRYAVIYYKGEKQSISDYSCIPSTIIIDASVLDTLPDIQRKATMLDALCHGIESYWSVNSTDESKMFAEKSIRQILENMESYLVNDTQGNARMLEASNIAGRAINITQTTAGHAMCYKLTGLYGIPHGYAAALCVSRLWFYMLEHIEKCIDPRGIEYVNGIFNEIAFAMGCDSASEAAEKFENILKSLHLDKPVVKNGDYDVLKVSVNPVRLRNNPVELDIETIDLLYHQILQKG